MTKKIGFIGVGNMGSAIIGGLALRKDIELHGVDPHKANLDRMAASGLKPHTKASAMTKQCDYIVIAVKPQYAEDVVKEIVQDLDESKCLISICAGIPRATFRDWTESRCPVVRVMPNTPALVSESVSAHLPGGLQADGRNDVVRARNVPLHRTGPCAAGKAV